jgi:hypothetical protein
VGFTGSALQTGVDFPVKLQDKAKASNETQQRANASKSDGMQRSGADALGGAINKGAEVVKKQTGTAFTGAAGLQKNIDFPVKLQDKAKASNETQERANASKSDGMDRAGADALGGFFSKGADAVTGGNLPSFGGAADQAKGVADKAAGAAKGATGGNPLEGAAGDAKNALGSLKQGGGDISTKPVGSSGSTAGLQVNVGQTTFGRGETGTFKDQAQGAVDELKENASNPLQATKNAASRTGQEANRVLSNPAGGPEQSQRAAQQLADANAEVPRAISGGLAKAKEAITSPASFNPFDEAALRDGTALEA